MAGSPPPVDAPPPEEQEAEAADASFADSPSGSELCGFPTTLPAIQLPPAFALPAIDFENPFQFDFALQLKCDLEDPVDAPDGGGRVGDTGLQDDPDYED